MKRKSERSCDEKEEEDDVDFEPKLTRSKAKKLLQEQPNIVWPITPLKKITQSDLDFINEELPEESDDEEYKPSLDDLQDQSEEESGRHSVVSTISHNSALEISVSQYLENFDDNLLENDSIKCLSDNLFKVPGENIGQRTRSKLCLSDTPLEAIEKAFVPPDITTDMYDFKCDNEDWENFLKEFMQPLNNDLDDDDEADPEYNALADEEEMYKEELRKDKAVKISRKELRKLMAELFECPDELSSDEEEEKRVKTEITNKVNLEIKEKAQLMKEEEVAKENTTLMTKTQVLLLQQQLRQHVQLTTQHFLQSYEHPLYSNYAQDCKIILATLLEMSKSKGDSGSVFNIYNLEPAFKLVEEWEMRLLSKEGKEIKEHMEGEIERARKAKNKGNYHRIKFHPTLLKLISESKVFLYPLLLPPHGFRCDGPFKTEFVAPEDSLIAIGLEEFSQFLRKNPRWFDKSKCTEKAACELLCDYLMPVKKPGQVSRRIRHVKDNDSNPVSYYRERRQAPKTIHYVIPFNDYLKRPPCEREKKILPEMFRQFIYPETEEGENKENDHG